MFAVFYFGPEIVLFLSLRQGTRKSSLLYYLHSGSCNLGLQRISVTVLSSIFGFNSNVYV